MTTQYTPRATLAEVARRTEERGNTICACGQKVKDHQRRCGKEA